MGRIQLKKRRLESAQKSIQKDYIMENTIFKEIWTIEGTEEQLETVENFLQERDIQYDVKVKLITVNQCDIITHTRSMVDIIPIKKEVENER